MEGSTNKVFFVRHAKSSWGNSDISDLERPLNERGHFVAPKMAIFIQQNFDIKDIVFISSPAKRAFTTANYFSEIYGVSKKDIHIDENLYAGDENDYLKCLQSLGVITKVAFIFGHNPTIESLVGKLTNPYHGLVPTCGVFYAKTKKDNWKIQSFSDLKLEAYYFPKIHLEK